MKPASGTWGTGVGILLYWPFERWNRLPRDGGMLWAYALVVLLLTAIGIWASSYAETVYSEKDPHRVVIDEIAGFFFSMILIPWNWQWVAAAFFIFRVFDVWKPAPIRGLQRLRGGWGIMIDDILAGIYTCVVLQVTRLILNR